MRSWKTNVTGGGTSPELLLQFSHDGEVVENEDIARVKATANELQFSHDGEVVENGIMDCNRIATGLASIQPRR